MDRAVYMTCADEDEKIDAIRSSEMCCMDHDDVEIRRCNTMYDRQKMIKDEEEIEEREEFAARFV